MTNTDKTLRFYERMPWLYNKIQPRVAFEDYMAMLNRKTDTLYTKYICPDNFKIDILEKYKDSHLWTYSVIIPNMGIQFFSFFAPSLEVVLTSTVGIKKDDENQLIAGISLDTNKASHFFEFLKENKEFLLDTEEKHMGFGL